MLTVLSLCWRYVRAFVIIDLCLYVGNTLSFCCLLPFPAAFSAC
nr:CidB/LrgB family autolysis modulator [Candidatus Pantoea persica]